MEGDSVTRVGLEHRATGLRAELAAKQAALGEIQASLAATLREGERVSSECAASSAQVEALQASIARVQASLRATQFDKQKAAEWGGACERMLARFVALEAGKLPSVGTSAGDVAGVKARLREAEAGAAAVGDLCQHLQTLHWDLAEAINRVKELMLLPTLQKIQAVM